MALSIYSFYFLFFYIYLRIKIHLFLLVILHRFFSWKTSAAHCFFLAQTHLIRLVGLMSECVLGWNRRVRAGTTPVCSELLFHVSLKFMMEKLPITFCFLDRSSKHMKLLQTTWARLLPMHDSGLDRLNCHRLLLGADNASDMLKLWHWCRTGRWQTKPFVKHRG